MDFTKFIDLISTQEIFFSRIDKLDDKYEATFPLANDNHPSVKNNKIVEKFYNSRKKINYENREWIYINCWHINEHESAAMWQLYGKSRESIAIETTYENLKNLLPQNTKIGIIHYLDYNSESINRIDSVTHIFYKRKSFEHEKEVRIYLQDENISENGFVEISKKNNSYGKKINIEIEKLITTIHVSPTADEWFLELVKKVVQEDYKLNIEVDKSDLYKDPIY